MDNRPTLEETMANLAETISKAPPEKQEEVNIFLEGYLAGLERALEKAAS